MKFSALFVAFASMVGMTYAVCEDQSGYDLCTNGLTIGDENCCDSPNDGRFCCTQQVPCVASNGDMVCGQNGR